jgi:predicted dehydrogenase
MRFALLGNHPDGLEMAVALVASGRHQLVVTTQTPPADHPLGSLFANVPRQSDLEEVLADPAVEAVIVAGDVDVRPKQLRRALQAERHVLCVHPPDDSPALAHEAAMLREDNRVVLLPLLSTGLHPAIRCLAILIEQPGTSPTPLGSLQLVELEWAAREEVLTGITIAHRNPSFPTWDILRRLGGEVAELSGFAEREELTPGAVVLLAGRFARGGLLQARLLPARAAESRRLVVTGEWGWAELYYPQGDHGPAFLTRPGPDGQVIEESWDRWDPWPALVEQFEAALAGRDRELLVTWQDTVRALELDDTARRSVERRRADRLDYQVASEEVGFKGTMTLVGCGVLLISMLLLIVARWFPAAGWLIVPLLVIFLGLQFLRPLAGRRHD